MAIKLTFKSHWFARYGGAVAAVGGGALLRLGLTAWVGPDLPTYITFYPSVMFVALLAGLGPGVLATALAALVVDYWLLPPATGFGIERPVDAVGLALFSIIGLIWSVAAEFYRRVRWKAAAYDKELALRETQRQKEFLADIIEHSSQAFGVGYLDGHLGLVNPAFEQLTGYRAEELRTLDWAKTLTPSEWQEVERRKLEELRATGQPVRYEKEYLRKDGTRVPIELLVHLVRDTDGKPEYYYSFITDITERKRATEAERRLNAELRQRLIEFEAASAEIQASRRAALSLAEDTLEARQEAERINAELQKANESLDASRRAAVNLMDDAIRARKQAEQATADIRSAAEQRRLVLEAADLGAWDYHFQTGEVYWNARCREMWGLAQAETIGYAKAIAAIHLEDRTAVDEAVKQALAGKDGGAYHREFRVVWPDVSAHWIASHGRVYFQGEGDQRRPLRFVGANQDITQRRQREEQLHNLNRTLKAHSKSDQALMRAQGEAEYLKQICRIVIENCGHAMVWVGFAEEDEARTVRPAAQAGFEEGYLETLNVTWADTERGRGLTGTAIRTGQPCMCRNMMTDPTFAPWRAEASIRGYASSLVLPLLAEGRAFGALTIYSRKTNGFSEAEAKLLTSLAADLAYGITALRLRSAKARAEEAQRQSEERYRGLVELSPEALFVNRSGRIVLVNPAALQLFGASSAEQLLGKSPFEVFHPDCHAMMQERIRLVLSGERVPVLEEKIIRLDGALVDVEVVAAPVMDQGERAIQVLLRDIT
jgi:PAS domain S-box-containing protein